MSTTMVDSLYRVFEILYPGASQAPASVLGAGSNVPLHALVGETIEIRATRADEGAVTHSIVSAPEGSDPELDFVGNALTLDVVGVWTLRIASDKRILDWTLRVFPAEAVDHPLIADPNVGRHPSSPGSAPLRTLRTRREILARVASNCGHGTFTDAQFNALTAEAPVPVGIDLGELRNAELPR